jgi:hypothetical protein
MSNGKSSHTVETLNTNHNTTANMNSKTFHNHIPRIYNGMDKTFNSFSGSGGVVECSICGQVLMDNPS